MIVDIFVMLSPPYLNNDYPPPIPGEGIHFPYLNSVNTFCEA